jgi:hypothetical protein
MVDISADLRWQRQEFMKKRDNATRVANTLPNTDLGRLKAQECKNCDLAIANLDEALKAYE